MLAWALAAVGIAAAVVLAVYYHGHPASRPSVVRSTITATENALLGNGPWLSGNPTPGIALSPDGLQLAFAAALHGTAFLWLRPLGAPSARPLAGTEGAYFPFWSPDSRFIGFFAEEKFEVSGGAIQRQL